MHVHLSFSILEGNEDENDEVYEVCASQNMITLYSLLWDSLK
jgi:hypothetical protein